LTTDLGVNDLASSAELCTTTLRSPLVAQQLPLLLHDDLTLRAYGP
jgi:hypothetical protein